MINDDFFRKQEELPTGKITVSMQELNRINEILDKGKTIKEPPRASNNRNVLEKIDEIRDLMNRFSMTLENMPSDSEIIEDKIETMKKQILSMETKFSEISNNMKNFGKIIKLNSESVNDVIKNYNVNSVKSDSVIEILTAMKNIIKDNEDKLKTLTDAVIDAKNSINSINDNQNNELIDAVKIRNDELIGIISDVKDLVIEYNMNEKIDDMDGNISSMKNSLDNIYLSESQNTEKIIDRLREIELSLGANEIKKDINDIKNVLSVENEKMAEINENLTDKINELDISVQNAGNNDEVIEKINDSNQKLLSINDNINKTNISLSDHYQKINDGIKIIGNSVHDNIEALTERIPKRDENLEKKLDDMHSDIVRIKNLHTGIIKEDVKELISAVNKSTKNSRNIEKEFSEIRNYLSSVYDMDQLLKTLSGTRRAVARVKPASLPAWASKQKKKIMDDVKKAMDEIIDIAIIRMLSQFERLSATQIEKGIHVNASLIRTRLRYLGKSNKISKKKEGRYIFYSLK